MSSTRELLALLDLMQRVVIETARILEEKTTERDELLRKLQEPEPSGNYEKTILKAEKT